MNIDVRNIKGKVLHNMTILLKDFSSTAKATRFVIESHFELKEKIIRKENEISCLKDKIYELEERSKNDNDLRQALKSFLNTEG